MGREQTRRCSGCCDSERDAFVAGFMAGATGRDTAYLLRKAVEYFTMWAQQKAEHA